jgi:hypothetical protein
MNSKRIGKWLIKFSLVPICALTVAIFLLILGIRTHAQNKAQSHSPVHVTNDWSNRHMVYSAPSTPAQEQKLKAEPRYINQVTERNNGAPQAKGDR